MSDKAPEQIAAALAAPFDPHEVKFKPAVVTGNRALALHYVDARVVMDRLDDVLGLTHWQDEYEILPDGSVMCRLRVCIEGQWLTKADVGSPSEQPDEGDRMKAAFSDALKRAAVKYGVGRYLYRLPSQWVDYDPQRKQFTKPPRLPATATATPARKAPTPGELITGREHEELSDLLNRIHEREEDLCDLMEISDLSYLPAAKYGEIQGHLRSLLAVVKLAKEKKADLQKTKDHFGVNSLLQLTTEQCHATLKALRAAPAKPETETANAG